MVVSYSTNWSITHLLCKPGFLLVKILWQLASCPWTSFGHLASVCTVKSVNGMLQSCRGHIFTVFSSEIKISKKNMLAVGVNYWMWIHKRLRKSFDFQKQLTFRFSEILRFKYFLRDGCQQKSDCERQWHCKESWTAQFIHRTLWPSTGVFKDNIMNIRIMIIGLYYINRYLIMNIIAMPPFVITFNWQWQENFFYYIRLGFYVIGTIDIRKMII